jgi:hypothetical protein
VRFFASRYAAASKAQVLVISFRSNVNSPAKSQVLGQYHEMGFLSIYAMDQSEHFLGYMKIIDIAAGLRNHRQSKENEQIL